MDFEEQLRRLDEKDEALVRQKLEELEAQLFGELPTSDRTNQDEHDPDARFDFQRDGEMHTATQPADPREWMNAFPYIRVRGKKCTLHSPEGINPGVLAIDTVPVEEVLEEDQQNDNDHDPKDSFTDSCIGAAKESMSQSSGEKNEGGNR